ncbi:MAG: hypothetical protein FJ386_06580 [Verrucomicrobia bacterium]|nr:hypothetical protein [Verrucomicrobiota bacterium]
MFETEPAPAAANLGEPVKEDIALGVDSRPPAGRSNSGVLLTLASGRAVFTAAPVASIHLPQNCPEHVCFSMASM